MEPRKLINFGTSSYIISIPKAWINKNSLKKGDFVYCSEDGNGDIVLSPQQKEIKKELTKITINAGKKAIKDVKREIISDYISGYDVITVQAQAGIRQSNELRDIIRGVTTMDIIEHSKTRLVAKDFLNLERVSLEELTRRMDLIIRSMIEDNKHLKKDDLDKIYNMDIEVNRITFMIFRFIKKALNDNNLAKLFGLSSEDLLRLWLLTSHLEKLADETKRVARFLKVANLNKNEFEEFMGVYRTIEKEYFAAIKSYYNKDKELALAVTSNREGIVEMCDKLAKTISKKVISSIIEKLKGMEVYVVYVSNAVYE